jgi:ribosome recycling factor
VHTCVSGLQDEAQKMLDGAMKKLDMAVANKEKSLLESK